MLQDFGSGRGCRDDFCEKMPEAAAPGQSWAYQQRG